MKDREFFEVGNKVKYSNSEAGDRWDIELCEKHLKLGEVYTISEVHQYRFFTFLELVGQDGYKFNSVNFSIVDERIND